MASVKVETIINAPIQKVYDFLTDPNKIPLVLTGLIENSNIPPLPLKVGDKFNYKYQMYGVMLDGDWTATKLEPPTAYDAHTTGGAESDWRYVLQDQNGSTHVALNIEYEPPQSVLQRAQIGIIERLNQHEAEAYMQNLKVSLELQNE